MNNVTLNLLKDTLSRAATFVYETPLSVIATTVAGIAACVFAPSLAPPLLALAGTVMLTRVAVKVLERYNLDLFIEFNEKMEQIDSKYGKLYYMAFTVTILTSMMFPVMGIALGIGVGVYKGLIVELQIQKIKQDTKEQEARFSLLSPSAWLARF